MNLRKEIDEYLSGWYAPIIMVLVLLIYLTCIDISEQLRALSIYFRSMPPVLK